MNPNFKIGKAGRWEIIGLVIGLLAIGLIFSSCGEKKIETETPVYEGWSKYTYGHFVIHFSPTTRYAADKAGLARAFERFLTEICNILEMPVPEGEIGLYVYANGSEAKKLTGREAPFSDDSTIHWAGLHPYGYQLTKFLLHKKGIQPGQFTVLNEGIANLLDFSGFNYHDRTNRLYNSGRFVGLSVLGDNDAFDSLSGYASRSESASLTGFIMYTYGVDRLMMFHSSLTGWEEAIEALFHEDMDKLEQSWLDFARQQSNDPKGTVENDSTYKLRIEAHEQ